jgi:hypothetical protein
MNSGNTCMGCDRTEAYCMGLEGMSIEGGLAHVGLAILVRSTDSAVSLSCVAL